MCLPLLFVIFVNDLDEVVTQIEVIKKFADDTKLGQRMTKEQDRTKLRDALVALSTWLERWGMEFNIPGVR